MENQFIPAARPEVGEDEKKAVLRVMDSGMVAQGPEVSLFEEEFSQEALGGAFAHAVNSGTSALHLGILSAGIEPGDEVIVPSFTFAATANSVAAAGAVPVFADVDEYFTLDAADVESKITGKTKAIMPVHLYGHPANMDSLTEIAKNKNLQIFEDCAQAHLATWDGKQVGTFGEFGAFSFYPTKNMMAAEGGMVSTKNPNLLRKVGLFRNQGMEVRYQNEVVGFNNRMTDIHAAIGRVQLGKLRGWTEKRQSNAEYLNTNISSVITPMTHEKASHVFHQYTILVEDDRDGFQEALKNEFGVGTGVYYPIPNHELPSLKRYSASALELPRTARFAAECLSLPVYPSLTEAELERIVQAVETVAKAGA